MEITQPSATAAKNHPLPRLEIWSVKLHPIAYPLRVLCSVRGGGIRVGYWALIAQHAAEQFGTNLRATVMTSVPNLVRGALIPINLIVANLKPTWGRIPPNSSFKDAAA